MFGFKSNPKRKSADALKDAFSICLEDCDNLQQSFTTNNLSDSTSLMKKWQEDADSFDALLAQKIEDLTSRRQVVRSTITAKLNEMANILTNNKSAIDLSSSSSISSLSSLLVSPRANISKLSPYIPSSNIDDMLAPIIKTPTINPAMNPAINPAAINTNIPADTADTISPPIVTGIQPKTKTKLVTNDKTNIFCSCKFGCTNNKCGCKKRGQKCSPSCICTSCVNYISDDSDDNSDDDDNDTSQLIDSLPPPPTKKPRVCNDIDVDKKLAKYRERLAKD